MADPKTQNQPKPEPQALDHAGRPVFVLVPFDQKLARAPRELVENLNRKLETPAQIRDDLRIARFRGNEVLYTCVSQQKRLKNEDGDFEMQDAAELSVPVYAEQFMLSAQDEDGLGGLNLPELIEAVTRSLKNEKRGRWYEVRLSADKNNLKILGS